MIIHQHLHTLPDGDGTLPVLLVLDITPLVVVVEALISINRVMDRPIFINPRTQSIS